MLWSASSIGDSSWVALKSRSVSSSVLELLMSSPPDNILIQNRTSENIICMHFLIEWAISKTGPWRIFTRGKLQRTRHPSLKSLWTWNTWMIIPLKSTCWRVLHKIKNLVNQYLWRPTWARAANIVNACGIIEQFSAWCEINSESGDRLSS